MSCLLATSYSLCHLPGLNVEPVLPRMARHSCPAAQAEGFRRPGRITDREDDYRRAPPHPPLPPFCPFLLWAHRQQQGAPAPKQGTSG